MSCLVQVDRLVWIWNVSLRLSLDDWADMETYSNEGKETVTPEQSLMRVLQPFRRLRMMYLLDEPTATSLGCQIQGWRDCLAMLGRQDPWLDEFGHLLGKEYADDPVRALLAQKEHLGEDAALEWFFDRYEDYLHLGGLRLDRSLTWRPMEEREPVLPSQSMERFLLQVRKQPEVHLIGTDLAASLDHQVQGWRNCLAIVGKKDLWFEAFKVWLEEDSQIRAVFPLWAKRQEVDDRQAWTWFWDRYDTYLRQEKDQG